MAETDPPKRRQTTRRRTARRPKPAPPAARYLTAAQAAERIQRSPRTLKRWRSRGGGPPFSRFADGRVRYAIADLDEYMAARKGSEPADFEDYRPTIVKNRRSTADADGDEDEAS